MKYGLIGEHLGHSFSKEIHEQINDYKYEIKELKPHELGEFLIKREFNAINVTIPYKEKVIPYLDYIDEAARNIGAVNTIVKKNNQLYGYNTDYHGLKSDIIKHEIEIKNKNVLILGSGGASKCAQVLVKDLGAHSIKVVSLNPKDDEISYDEAKQELNTNVIINATPCGMYPNNDDLIMDITNFLKLEAIVDVIYNPLKTRLVLLGQKRALKTCGGLYMLVAQAVYASGYFVEENPKLELIDSIYQNLLYNKQNIVLIGMPSSGKSTIGKYLAESLGKTFYDLDVVIEEKIQMPIKDYIETFGEDSFRNLEEKVTLDICKGNNLIIATGGGIIKRPNNILNLKGNGVIVFLNRELQNLEVTDSRPLSNNIEKLTKLYCERLPIYLACADLVIDNNADIETTIKTIINEVSK